MTYTKEELEKALRTFLSEQETTKKGAVTAQGKVFVGVFYIILGYAERAKEAQK